jgi:hypothetical protein
MAGGDAGRRSMKPTSSDRWSRFRFLVVGPLLAAPPAAGELRLALAERAQMQWTHPISGVPVRFGPSSGARGMLARSASGGRPSIR